MAMLPAKGAAFTDVSIGKDAEGASKGLRDRNFGDNAPSCKVDLQQNSGATVKECRLWLAKVICLGDVSTGESEDFCAVRDVHLLIKSAPADMPTMPANDPTAITTPVPLNMELETVAEPTAAARPLCTLCVTTGTK
jgi:hypothetical protein